MQCIRSCMVKFMKKWTFCLPSMRDFAGTWFSARSSAYVFRITHQLEMLHKEMAMTCDLQFWFSHKYWNLGHFSLIPHCTSKVCQALFALLMTSILFFKFESELCKIVSYCWKSKIFYKYENIYKNSKWSKTFLQSIFKGWYLTIMIKPNLFLSIA